MKKIPSSPKSRPEISDSENLKKWDEILEEIIKKNPLCSLNKEGEDGYDGVYGVRQLNFPLGPQGDDFTGPHLELHYGDEANIAFFDSYEESPVAETISKSPLFNQKEEKFSGTWNQMLTLVVKHLNWHKSLIPNVSTKVEIKE